MENLDNLKEIWKKVVDGLELEIGKDPVEMWIKPLKPLVLEEDLLKIEVPNSIFRNNISEKYEKNIVEILRKELNKTVSLDYLISGIEDRKEPFHYPSPVPPPSQHGAAKVVSYINLYYTFDAIVVGDFNRFSYNIAKNVAQAPGTNQNPFFMYSEPGMGKTHFLHAIGNEILKARPGNKILYLSAESFVNEYITAIQEKNQDAFRNKYRNLDCLLLDDIQFIVKKEKSEEEFFHTFNALFDSKKQIVVTSDRKPNDLELNERLISRFKSGVIADIGKPEYESKVAILNEENERNKFNIPQDIINFVAEKVTDNIRSLKGCISTIGHYSSQNNVYPSIDLAQNLIKDYIIPGGDSYMRDKVKIETIKEMVSETYGVSAEELASKSRTERVSFARQIAIYLACSLTDKSLPEIGDDFNKDHSTVIYSRDKITQLMNNDPFFSEQVNSVVNKIKSKKS